MVINSNSLKQEIKKGLYLVSTPIGNLGDITYRALEILRKSDYILCEDTRISKNLLNKYEISSQLISNHKFNEKKNLSKIIKLLKSNLIVSLICDAGTPSISDPGAILVNECIKKEIDIIPVPGPSAAISAVSISGFSDKFFFYGFFPEKTKNLNEDLEILSNLDCSLVFFVSGKKINKIIPFLKKKLSGRKILICREISKFYEEFIRDEVDKIKLFDENLKGELTVVISEKNNKKTSQNLSESDKSSIKKMINKFTIKEIVNFINQKNKVSKREIYNYCIKLKK
tara:strand:+ start:4323 stop:5177 length:855 start_codon:yes stop_codon:yes gene_type:complete